MSRAEAQKGTRGEHRAVKALEADGYLVTRAAGSLGLFDLVAVGLADVRLVQVKAGNARANGRTITQFRAIAALAVGPFVVKEIWIYRDRVRAPEIRLLPDAAALASWRGRSRASVSDGSGAASAVHVSPVSPQRRVPRALPATRDGGGTPARLVE